MADKKASANPWGNLNFGSTKGSNQVTAAPSDHKIKPTAVQNKAKATFIKIASNLN